MLLVVAFQVIVLGFLVDESFGCFLGGTGVPGCGLKLREVNFNGNISYIIICYIKLKQAICLPLLLN